MNNIFNIRRFGNYCLKQVNEWMRGLSLQLISLAGVYTTLMFVFRFGDSDGQPYIASGGAQFIIWLSFFVYIAKASSNLSRQIGRRSRRVLYLVVPASTFEKYMAHLLSVLVLYPFVFFTGILVAQYTSELLSALVWQNPFHPGFPLEGCFSGWDQHSVFGLKTFWVLTFNIVAVFTLGATIWKRGAFIKTIAAMVIINMISTFIWIVSINSSDLIGLAMDNLTMFDNEQEVMNAIILYSYITVIVFAVVGYMRMKELEVNETKR